MAVYYLTQKQLAEKYSKELTKKELKAQAVGHTITINDDQIVILPEHMNPKTKKNEEPNAGS